MTLALVAALVVAAPRAPADAELSVYVPRLDAVEKVLPFFDTAGARSVMLRPASWREEAHPLLKVDVTSRESLTQAGIDPAGSLTVTRKGVFSISCLTLADVKKHQAASDERLKRLGELSTQTVGGVTIRSAKDQLGRVQAAYALKGAESCAISGFGNTVDKELPGLAKLLGANAAGLPGFKLAAELPGAAYFVWPDGKEPGAIAVSTSGLTLTLDGKSKGVPLLQLAGAGTSPFAQLAPPGMITLRLRVAKAAVPALLDQVTRQLPNGGALGPAATALAPMLTGNAALYVQAVKVTSGLRSVEQRFFALKLVLLAETSDPAQAKAALDAVDASKLATRLGAVEVGVQGSTVWLSTDAAARELALKSLPAKATAQAHAGEVAVDPALLAKGLSQVPLSEAVQNAELAGLLAVSAELGPLLLGSEKITGWLDGAGAQTHRAQLTWALKQPATDGGAR